MLWLLRVRVRACALSVCVCVCVCGCVRASVLSLWVPISLFVFLSWFAEQLGGNFGHDKKTFSPPPCPSRRDFPAYAAPSLISSVTRPLYCLQKTSNTPCLIASDSSSLSPTSARRRKENLAQIVCTSWWFIPAAVDAQSQNRNRSDFIAIKLCDLKLQSALQNRNRMADISVESN